MTECMGCHGKAKDGIDPTSIGWRQGNFGLKGILVWMCERCAKFVEEGLAKERNGELLAVPSTRRLDEAWRRGQEALSGAAREMARRGSVDAGFGVEVFRNRWGAAFVAWRRQGNPAAIVVAGKETVLQDYLVGAAFCHPMDLPRTSWSRRDWRIKGEEIAIGRMNKRRGLIRTEAETSVRRALMMALVEPHLKGIPCKDFNTWDELDLAVARWGIKPYAYNEAGSFLYWYWKFMAHLYSTEVGRREQERETEGMSCLMEAQRENPARMDEGERK